MFDPSILDKIFKIIVALLLVLLNGLFVAAEFAFVRVRPTRIAHLANQGNKRAERARDCITHLDDYLSVSQLGITLASLGLGWLGEPAIAELIRPLFQTFGVGSPALLHSVSFVIAFSVITFLHVVFGELAPKSLAIQKAETVSLYLSGPMKAFYYIFYPGVVILNGSANKVLKLFGIQTDKNPDGTHSEEELRMLISNSYKQGQINKNEQTLLQNVFKFEKRVAEEIMVPRPDVIFLNASLTLEQNLSTARKSQHTRYPLCDGNPDHVLGILHIKDVFNEDNSLNRLEDVTRTTIFIPENMRLDDLLREFQHHHQHMAIVIDEYGGTAGIVTMDNILEELVGEIQDEFDKEDPDFSLLEDGSLSIDGRMDIGDAVEEFSLPINVNKEDYNTLAGFVMGQLGKMPREGDRVTVGRFQLEVEKMTGQRIDSLRLKIPAENTRQDE
ncbi:MAG: hemolysin family protein [Bacillota bacterium]|nr:hemolysin family protein [Bacillota bacterium]